MLDELLRYDETPLQDDFTLQVMQAVRKRQRQRRVILWGAGAVGAAFGVAHAYSGEEAVAVGVCSALRQDDWIASTHRGHGHMIAKGADLKKMVAELFGKKTGYCKGKGGSMHIADLDLGIMGANGIVGGGPPLAAGAAGEQPGPTVVEHQGRSDGGPGDAARPQVVEVAGAVVSVKRGGVCWAMRPCKKDPTPAWWNGRHKRLKISGPEGRAGSSPAAGTT